MTEETPKQEETDAPEILNAEDPSCVDAQSDDAAQDAAPQDVAPLTPEEKIEALETELAKQKEQVLRQLAETENARRRAQREREDTIRYGASALAKDLLNVAENSSKVQSEPFFKWNL